MLLLVFPFQFWFKLLLWGKVLFLLPFLKICFIFFQPVFNVKQDILHFQTFSIVSCDVNLSQLFLLHFNSQSWKAGCSLGQHKEIVIQVSLSCLYIVNIVKKNQCFNLEKKKTIKSHYHSVTLIQDLQSNWHNHF